MNNRDFKLELLETLKNRQVYTDQPSSIEIRTRCPFCGDSKTNIHTGHLYIRINPNDNYPVVYNCFKCPASGILKAEDLELLDIDNNDIKNKLEYLNKTSDKPKSGSYVDEEEKYFEYKIPKIHDFSKIKYIENRLGKSFSSDDLYNMRVIVSLKDFLKLNKIDTITCKPSMAEFVEKQYIGFLSNNNSYILFRDTTDKEDIRWYKYPITQESIGQKTFYSIKSSIDLYSTDKIIINLSEGVFDAISIAHNINDNKSDNILNIAVCGKYYNRVIKKLIGMGFIGSNIIINLYSDNDHTDDTSVEYYRHILKKYSYLVGEFNVIYNKLYKDCGVQKDKIMLQKYKIY